MTNESFYIQGLVLLALQKELKLTHQEVVDMQVMLYCLFQE